MEEHPARENIVDVVGVALIAPQAAICADLRLRQPLEMRRPLSVAARPIEFEQAAIDAAVFVAPGASGLGVDIVGGVQGEERLKHIGLRDAR